MTGPNPWIACPKPNPDAGARLFCFPYAGGSATLFHRWGESLARVEVCAVQYPGRGVRVREVPRTNLLELAEEATAGMLPLLDRPFAFFGHSMGALVGFEVARLLRKRHGLIPRQICVSGRSSPQQKETRLPIHALQEPEFIEELRNYNGTPAEVLENAELLTLLMPMLRADFSVVETYQYAPEPPLDCPITAYGGSRDDRARRDGLEGWREQTTASFSVRMFPGDHFFLNTFRTLVLQTLSQDLHHLTK